MTRERKIEGEGKKGEKGGKKFAKDFLKTHWKTTITNRQSICLNFFQLSFISDAYSKISSTTLYTQHVKVSCLY